MAGFMSGFGSAFAQSFNAASAQRAAAEQDEFRMRFQEAKERRQRTEELEREDEKAIKYAKQAAKMYTGSEQAWGEIYRMKQGGMDDSAIQSFLESHTVEITPTSGDDGSGPADPRDNLPASAASSVDAQMQASGMAPPAPGETSLFGGADAPAGTPGAASVTPDMATTAGVPAGENKQQVGLAPNEPKPTEPKPEKLTGAEGMQVSWKKKQVPDLIQVSPGTAVWDKNSGKVVFTAPKEDDTKWMNPKDSGEALNNLIMAEQRGDTDKIPILKKLYEGQQAEDVVKATNAAKARGELYTPRMGWTKDGKIAYLANDQWVEKDSGKPLMEGEIAQSLSEEANETLTDIAKDNNTLVKPYQEKATSFVGAVKDINDMEQLIAENPDVAGWGGQLAKATDTLVRNIGGTLNLFRNGQVADANGMVNPAMLTQLSSTEGAIKEKLNTMVGPSFMQSVEKQALARSLWEIKGIKLAYAKAAGSGQSGAAVSANEFKKHYDAIVNKGPDAFKTESRDWVLGEYEKLKQQGDSIIKGDKLGQLFKIQTGRDSPIPSAIPIDELLNSTAPQAMEKLKLYQNGADTVDPNKPNANQINPATNGMKVIGRTTDGKKLVYEDANGKRWTE